MPISAATTGRKAKKKKGRERNRQDDLKDYWKKERPDLEVKDYYWRVYAYRGNAPKGKRRVRLDPIITQLDWQDQEIQTANMTLVQSDPTKRLLIQMGHEITVYFSTVGNNGPWTTLFKLRVTSVTQSADGQEMQLEAADELEWLKRSRDDFQYKKGNTKSRHKRPNGWYCHQITRDVCRRYGIKVGKLSKGTHPIKNLTERNADPLSIIEKAYQKERDETGNKYVIRMRGGKLHVTRLRRSRELLIYGGNAISAEVTTRLKENFASVLSVRSQIKKDGDEQKVKLLVKSRRDTMRRYGRVHNFWNLDDPVDSRAAARRRARRELADRQKPDKEVSMTVPGYHGLQRGDAIRIALKPQGVRELAYISEASHSVSAGNYETTITLTFDDPFVDKEGDKIRKKICKKAREKGHKAPAFCSDNYDPFAPLPKKKKNRQDKDNPRAKNEKTKK
jgi:hypothetical protein